MYIDVLSGYKANFVMQQAKAQTLLLLFFSLRAQARQLTGLLAAALILDRRWSLGTKA